MREQDAKLVLKKVLRFDENATDRVKNSKEEQIGTMLKLWSDAPSNENIRGTGYGLYNAVTECVDHFRPAWGADDAELVRAERVVRGGEWDAVKERAFASLLVKG